MKPETRVAINTGILYCRMAVTVFISLYTTRVTLASLGIQDFGIFNVVAGAVAMLAFLNTGMAAATQRFMSYAKGMGDESRLNSIFNISLLLHSLIALGALFILEAVGWLLFKYVLVIDPTRLASAKLIYHFAAASTVLAILSVPYDAAINARENMLMFSILSILEVLAKLGIAKFIFVYSGDRLIAYGELVAILAGILLFVKVIYCSRCYSECRFSRVNSKCLTLAKEMSAFAGWSFMGASTSLVAHYSQGVVLNSSFGTTVNAAQGIANQVSGQLGALALTMLKALNPLIAKSEGAGDRALMLKASMLGSKFGFFLTAPLMLPFIIEMPYVLKVWLGSPPLYAIDFCRLLLIRNLIDQLFSTLPSTISAVGRIKSYQISVSIMNFLPILGSWWLFKMDFGPHYIYVCFIVFSISWGILMLYHAHVSCGLRASRYFHEVILRCLFPCLIALLVSILPYILMAETGERFLILSVLSASAFFVSVWIVGLGDAERRSIQRLLGGVKVQLCRRFGL